MALWLAPAVPWVANFTAGLLGGLFASSAKQVAKRLVVVAAVIAGIVAAMVVCFAAFNEAKNSLASITPPALSEALGLVYPANFPIILSALFAARVARWFYEWKVKFLQFRL